MPAAARFSGKDFYPSSASAPLRSVHFGRPVPEWFVWLDAGGFVLRGGCCGLARAAAGRENGWRGSASSERCLRRTIVESYDDGDDEVVFRVEKLTASELGLEVISQHDEYIVHSNKVYFKRID